VGGRVSEDGLHEVIAPWFWDDGRRVPSLG
jgi:hypothetical protein